MTHACNPSYSEGKDQEDGGSRLAWASSDTSRSTNKKLGKVVCAFIPVISATQEV
jgi:hypothetical protein